MKAMFTSLIEHGDKLWMAAIAGTLLAPTLGMQVPTWLVILAIAPFVLLPIAALLRP